MKEEIIRVGDEDCNHRYRCTFDDYGSIEFFFCIKCRRVIRDSIEA